MKTEPTGSKEERKVRNRVTAKKSRDKKNAYILELETRLRLANERVMELERRMEGMELQLAPQRQAKQAEEDEIFRGCSDLVDTMLCM